MLVNPAFGVASGVNAKPRYPGIRVGPRHADHPEDAEIYLCTVLFQDPGTGLSSSVLRCYVFV